MKARLAPSARALFLFASTIWLATAAARAFPVFESAIPVVEFHNPATGHYFLTASTSEMRDIEAGMAGPGWIRTGLAFYAFPPGAPRPGTVCAASCGMPVYRFHGASFNTHVFTANDVEAEILRQPGSGWTFEGVAFNVDVPNPAGECFAGMAPVARFYNNRGAVNDANHRYVSPDGERARMKARAWSEEGIAFCTVRPVEVPLHSFELAGSAVRISPSARCEDESINLGPCIAVNNLPPPDHLLPPTQVQLVPAEFQERTGLASSFNYVQQHRSAASPQDAAAGAFVQGNMFVIGLHVATSSRGPSIYSSINPLYQFKTTVDADGVDRRFRPFGTPWESDVQLSISGTLNVKRLRVANAASHAYGHPTLEFTDTRSGRNLYFTVGAYGTVPMQGDYLAPDSATGKVIVGTTLRGTTPYGRSSGISSLPTPSGFVAENSWGWGGPFDFRIDAAEFQRIVAAARSVDLALSADVRDYILDNFHFTNEVVGDGEIGLNLAGFRLQLLRR